jgi:hypothetical protein
MKLSSSVVTTSSTWNRVLSRAGPMRSSAPAAIDATTISGTRGRGEWKPRLGDGDGGKRADVELASAPML